MDIRDEFEKLDEIAEILKGGQYKFISNECGYYSDVEGVSTEAIDLAWYAFQEQQKKIDALKAKLDDAFLENAKLKHVIDEVKLHNGSLGFRSMQRMIEELLK